MSGYLTWEEFIECMKLICSGNLIQRIELFFKVLDEDGNGMFSYQEIYDIAKISLARFNDPKGEKFIAKMAHFMTKKIFAMFNISLEDEVPLD